MLEPSTQGNLTWKAVDHVFRAQLELNGLTSRIVSTRGIVFGDEGLPHGRR